ncbi:MAG: LysR family transcriptional regulator [Lachnospiraceae bacterium]|nr:LysR family transcriptional regulator [Lachnospiraceae bacterium]
MTLRHFRIFLSVYTHHNMTKAAKDLYISQPSVSQVIKELEDHYHVVLFERFPKELKPTAAGDLLFHYASSITDMNNELEDLMQQGSSNQILRIGSNDTVGTSFINGMIHQYMEDHPGEQIQVQVNRSSALADMLRSNDLDVILTDHFPYAPDLHSEPIFQDRLVIVASPDYEPIKGRTQVDAAFLSECRLLLSGRGTYERDSMEQYLSRFGYSITPFMESISFDTLLQFTLDGIGITVLPISILKPYLESGALIQLTLPEYCSYQTFVLGWHNSKYLSPSILDFIQLCRK